MAELGIDDGGEDTLPRSRRMKTRSQREDGVPSSRTESNHVTGDDIIELDSEQSGLVSKLTSLRKFDLLWLRRRSQSMSNLW